MTARRYIDILDGTFVVRQLQPWHVNVGKRLVKQPKLYIRDSGLLHTLLSLRSMGDLAAHRLLGASWEGFALEAAVRAIGLRNEQVFFWRTHSGAEADLFWQENGRNWAVEVKYADAPRLTPSMRSAVQDLDLSKLWVVYPGDREYALHDKVAARPLTGIGAAWEYGDGRAGRVGGVANGGRVPYNPGGYVEG